MDGSTTSLFLLRANFMMDMFIILSCAISFHQAENNDILGGGFKDFLFSPLLGEMIQFD